MKKGVLITTVLAIFLGISTVGAYTGLKIIDAPVDAPKGTLCIAPADN